MAFFEIRNYKILPGKMDAWLELMHTVIVPFQISKGMVLCASYRGEEDETQYVWIRRFESESERERLYAEVYQSDTWINEIAPQSSKLMDREAMVIHRVVATAVSPQH